MDNIASSNIMNIAIINGPNLNLLGHREKEIYGYSSLRDLEEYLKKNTPADATLDFFQSNYEGEIIEYIQKAQENHIDAFIINAAAYTHTSVAIRDSLLAMNIPFIEVHLSNTHKREKFRHTSLIADIAKGVIMGLGREGYLLAIKYFTQLYHVKN